MRKGWNRVPTSKANPQTTAQKEKTNQSWYVAAKQKQETQKQTQKRKTNSAKNRRKGSCNEKSRCKAEACQKKKLCHQTDRNRHKFLFAPQQLSSKSQPQLVSML